MEAPTPQQVKAANGEPCAVCWHPMDNTDPALAPTYSETFASIVCADCATDGEGME
jgi:hypothetical protein